MILDPAATCVTGTIRCLRHRSVRQAEAGFAAILLIGCAANAHAASVTNEDTEPSISEWYDGLTQPATGKRCCSVADCKPYDSRIRKDHWEIFIHGVWETVPNKEIVHTENPVGAAVACLATIWDYSSPPPHFTIRFYCFVAAPET